ncbi:MAG TPA: PqqD family protein [Thermoanaerobaculia bacterium]
MITLSSRLAVAPHVRFRRFEDEGVVVNQKAAEALVLNEVGTRLVEVADGSRTLQQLADLLGDEFDADADTIARDVLRFAGELVDAGVAQLVDS